MVCKEDVITWFKDAASYRRIDVMCSLLNMCVPFELRFLGTCIEERGKHDYQELRGAALTANDVDKLEKELSSSKGLLEESTRHRLAIYLSLLNSRSYNCANWLYRTIIRTDSFDSFVRNSNFTKDENLHTEIMLILTLAISHPAFTYEQKRYFADVLSQLYEPENQLQHTSNPPPCPPSIQPCIKGPFAGLQVYPMPVPVNKGPAPVCPDTTMPPPGIPLPPMHGDCVSSQGMWTRTPFINTSCPPPDIPNFPPPMSPLVSQQSSPTPSRSVSPSRMYACRPQPQSQTQPPAPPPMAPIVPSHMDRLPPNVKEHMVLTTPPFNTDLKTIPIEEVEHNECEKAPWMETMVLPAGMKMPNGMYSMVPNKCQRTNLATELWTLSLDNEPIMRCSNSSGSSNSSDSHSPPDTPTELVVAPHGPGRGVMESKVRMNGGNEMSSTPLYPVPYTQYGPPPNFPNRFFTQAYRPPFPYHQQNGELLYPYHPQYLPVVYSSALPPPPKTCCNCGMLGHLGADCKEPNIEEITQKGGYHLEYTSPPPPDASASADKPQ